MFHNISTICAIITRLLIRICNHAVVFVIENLKYWTNAHHPEHKHLAHKQKILWSYASDAFQSISEWDFILLHDDFVDPEYVLREEVSLMRVSENKALFIERHREAPSPNSVNYSFLLQGQIQHATHIISMPLSSFIQLAENSHNEESDSKLIFIHNTGRCGSTLLSHVFTNTGQVVSLAEPQAFDSVLYYCFTKKIWDEQMARRILVAVTKLLCKPYVKGQCAPLAFSIKPMAFAAYAMDFIRDVFPDAIHFFLYRSPIAVAVSCGSIMPLAPSSHVLLWVMYTKIPNGAARFLDYIGILNNMYKGWTPMKTTGLEFGNRVANKAIQAYLVSYRKNKNIHGIKYDDLVDAPERVVTSILKLCGLPESLATLALPAFTEDSQKTMFSASKRKQHMQRLQKSAIQLLPEAVKESNELKTPAPDEWTQDFHLPGTVC